MRHEGIIKYLMIFSAAAVLLLASAAYANDPPHVSGTATCTDCHNSAGMDTPSYGNIDNTPYNFMCWDCHTDVTSGTHKTHSSVVTGSQGKYGLWTYECRNCHNPHYQRQFRLNIDQAYPAGSMLFTGKIRSIDTGGGGIKNVLTLENLDGSDIAPGTWAINKWKDFIIKPNMDEQYYYLIINSSDNGNTAVINTTTEVVEDYYYGSYVFKLVKVGDRFALGYGKLVSEEITTKNVVVNASEPANPLDPNKFRDVFLFNKTGEKSGGSSQTDANAVCIVCHTKTRTTNYGFAKFGDAYEIDATMREDGITWTNTQYGTEGENTATDNTHLNTRDTTSEECFDNSDASCHKGHELGYAQGGADCGKCHGKDSMSSTDDLIKFIMEGGDYIGSTTGNAEPWGHVRHKEVGIVCNNCHLTGMVPESNEVYVGDELFLDVDFSLNLSNTLTGALYYGRLALNGYTYNGPSNWNSLGTSDSLGDGTMLCDNLYCHSDGGNYDLTAYVYQTAAWDDPTDNKCNICHGDSAASATESKNFALTTLHPKHTSDYPYSCYECHASVVNISNVIISQAKHSDGAKDVSFAAGGITQGGNWSKPACNNTYCHGDGNGGTTPVTGTFPDWGDTGSLNCGGCHNDVNDGIANKWSAAHTEHLDDYNGRFTCNACHSGVSNDAGDAILDTSLHVNAQKNVDINTTDYGPVGFYNTVGNDDTCYNVECHSTGVRFDEGIKNMPAPWAGVQGCAFCHEVAESATLMKDSTYPLSNSHIVHVATNAGAYGDPARNLGVGNMVAITCDNCHKGVTDDGLSINPGGYAANHVDFQNSVDFSVSDFNASSTDSWGSGQCDNSYCHGAIMPYGSGGGLDNTPTWNDLTYISSTDVEVRCGKCHAFPPVNYVGKGGKTTTHDGYVGKPAGDCVGCHQHMQATAPYFKPSEIALHINGFIEAEDCGGCHALPPMNASQIIGDPATGRGSASPPYANGGAGAHSLHNAVGFGEDNCSKCHSGGGTDGDHLGTYNSITFGFTHVLSNGTYNAPTFSQNAYFAVSGNSDTTVNNNVGDGAVGDPRLCYNTYCHSDGGDYGLSTYIYQAADWDATPANACDICHGAPGGEDVLTNVHPTHVTTYSYDCRECHALTVDATPDVIDNSLHVDGIKNVAFYTGAGNITGGGDYSNSPRCDNSYCHSPGNKDASFDVPLADANWDGSMPGDCTGCHGGDDTVTPVGNIITADAHNAHINSASAVGREMGCKECHLATVSDNLTVYNTATHVDRLLNIKFEISLNDGTPLYNGLNALSADGAVAPPDTGASCESLYCHSDGNTNPSVTPNYNAAIAWDTAQIGCDGCHGGSGNSYNHPDVDGPANDYANDHVKHVESSGTTCDKCHVKTTTESSTTPTTVEENSYHLNAIENVTFLTIGVYNGTYNLSTRECSATYCHGDGNGGATPVTGTLPEWGGAAIACGGCHNNVNDGITNTWSAAHTEHLDDYNGRFTCNACHSEVSNDAGDAILDISLHVDGVKNVAINTTDYGPVGFYNTVGNDDTCYNVKCHSTGDRFDKGIKNMPAPWAGVQGCAFCHEVAESASAMHASTYPLSNAHIVHVATASGEYGDPARNSLAITCDNCHKGVTDDGLTINPGGYAANHVDFQNSVDFSVSDFNASSTDSWTQGNKQCDNTYCHGNFMPYESGGGLDNDPTWNDLTYISSSDPAVRCAVCHAFPPVNYTGRGGSTTTHDDYVGEPASECVNCHQHMQGTSPYFKEGEISKHINGFVEGENCGGCHGIPPMDGTQLVQGASPVTGRGTYYSSKPGAGSGAHALHNAVGFGGGKCIVCHFGGGTDGSDHQASAYNGITFGFTHIQSQGKYNAPTFSDNNYIALSGDPGNTFVENNVGADTSQDPRKCYNTYCHSDGGNYGLSTYIYQAAAWDATPANACDICHGAPGGEDVLTNVHPTHVTTYSYDCRECHALTVDATPDVIDNSLHVDGIKNVAFYVGAGSITGDGTYANKPRCDNTYCHSPGNKNAAVFNSPLTDANWDGTMPGDCTGCHGGDATVTPVGNIITADAHNAHINSVSAVGREMGCKECHLATVSDNLTVYNTATHVDRLLNIKFESSLNGGTPLYNGLDALSADGAVALPDTGASCESLYCHSDGNTNPIPSVTPNYNAAIAWDTAQIGCDGCHGGSNKSYNHPDVAGPAEDYANDHVKHVENSGNTCDQCHIETTDDSTTVKENVYHLNGIENVTFRTIGGKSGSYNNPSTRQCSTTYCHGSATPYWGGASIACDGCHDADNSGGLSLRHDVHYNNTVATTSLGPANAHMDSGYGYGCGNCHPDASENLHTKGPANATIYQDADVNGTSITLGNYTPDEVNSAVDGQGYNYTEGGTCTTYCHSTGNRIGGGGISYIDTVVWNGTSTGDCDVCHDDSTTPLETNVHRAHINGTTYGYVCEECHAGTVSGNSTIDTKAKRDLHLDGINNVIWNGGVNQGGDAYTSSTCDNMYCHSQGIDLTVPFTVDNGPVAAAVWTSSPMGCGDCHTGGIVNGPYYANNVPKANSHEEHVVDSNNLCSDCHNSVVDSGNDIISSGYSEHVDGDYDVVNAAKIGGFVPNALGGTCNNISCHSGNNAQWGATELSCDVCHLDIGGGDVDNFTWDGTTSAISNDGWITAGHGRQSGNYPFSGRPAANFNSAVNDQCEYCHDKLGVGHRDSNIFRLRNIVNATWGINWNCQVCHSFDGPGVDDLDAFVTNTINAFHNGPDHSANNGGRLCWDCHDPHGDINPNSEYNIYMVQNVPFMKSDLTNGNMIYNATKYVVFITNADAYGYVNTSTQDGICQVCHTKTPAQGLNYFKYDSSGAQWATDYGHTNGDACYTCHSHNNDDPYKGFEGSGDCAGCHTVPDPTTEEEDFGTDGTATTMFQDFKTTIDDEEWLTRGHGRDTGTLPTGNPAPDLLSDASANTNKCLACHVEDATVAHEDTSNPFKLRFTDTQVCLDCHGSVASPGVVVGDGSEKTATKYVGAAHYNTGGGSNARHTIGGTYDGGEYCWNCHDPHGTPNTTYMLGLGPDERMTRDTALYGIPADGTTTYGDTSAESRTTTLVFTVNSTNWGRTDFVNATVYDGSKLCMTCHDGASGILHYGYNITPDGHNAPEDCFTCHKHDASGFQGKGESDGGKDCKGCHSDLYDSDDTKATMHGSAARINYKHYMNNAGTDDLDGGGDGFLLGGGSAPTPVFYPMDDVLDIAGVTNTTGETGRRCLMCHVDHDIFRSDLNLENIYGISNTRAGNMRTSMNEVPTNTTGYNDTDFDLTNPDGGVCVSCHFKARFKYVTTPNDATATPPIPFQLPGSPASQLANAVEILKRSTHSYQVLGGVYNGEDPDDTSRFKAVCLKCHNDSIGTNFGPKSSYMGQTSQGACFNSSAAIPSATDPRVCAEKGGFWNGEAAFGRHISSNDSSQAVMGTLFEQGIANDIDPGDNYTLYRDPLLPEWKTNQWVGYQVVITRGTGQNSRTLVIVQNQVDRLTVIDPFVATLDGTSQYDIVKSPFPQDDLCFSCHSKRGQNKHTDTLKDWYAQEPMKEIIIRMKDLFVGDQGVIVQAGAARSTKNPKWVSLCTKKTNAEVPDPDFFNKYTFKAGSNKVSIILDPTDSNTVPAPDSACDAYTNGDYPNMYQVYVELLPVALSGGAPYKIFKPAVHPLDAFGRHRPYERVTAGMPSPSYAGWNAGDEGASTNNISNATLEDDSKAWTASQWSAASTGEQMYVYIRSGANLGSEPQLIADNTATQLTLQGSTLLSNIVEGDQYYIGSATDSRHVSCADCHNTHASTNNPEGELEAGDVTVTNATTTQLASTGAYAQFWADGEWNSHLIKLRMRDGLEQIRFVSGFDADDEGDPKRGIFTVSHPWAVQPSDPACVGASGTTREECEGNGGTWESEHYELFMADKWNSCANPTYTTLSACDSAGYQWVYHDGGRAGSGSTGVWGVAVTDWPTPTGDLMTTAQLQALTWTKVENVFDKKAPYDYGGSANAGQTALCVRCHSYYSFKTAFPTTPSGHADGGTSPETDIVAEFNPKNVAHHAVYARGVNQPHPDSLVITGLPDDSFTGTYEGEEVVGGGTKDTFLCTDDDVSGISAGETVEIPSVGYSDIVASAGAATLCSTTTNEIYVDNGNGSGGATAGDAMRVYSPPTPPYNFNPNWPRWNGTVSSVDTVTNTVTFTADMPRTVLPGWTYIDVDVPSAGDWTFREVVSVDSPTQVTLKSTPTNTSGPGQLTSGLGNTFVPPFGPWSVLRCSDCHGSTKTDPVGPHASVNKWLLKDLDEDLNFEWYGGSPPSVQIVDPGNDLVLDKKYTCYNCHRRDVYGGINLLLPGNEVQSRVKHGTDMLVADTNNIAQTDATLWAQFCRQCHGGDKMGAIHGSNAANAKRFLNGSSWGGTMDNVPYRASTATTPDGVCYAGNPKTGSRVSSCTSHSTGGTNYGPAHYDYD